jgi:hypothetical protein
MSLARPCDRRPRPALAPTERRATRRTLPSGSLFFVLYLSTLTAVAAAREGRGRGPRCATLLPAPGTSSELLSSHRVDYSNNPLPCIFSRDPSRSGLPSSGSAHSELRQDCRPGAGSDWQRHRLHPYLRLRLRLRLRSRFRGGRRRHLVATPLRANAIPIVQLSPRQASHAAGLATERKGTWNAPTWWTTRSSSPAGDAALQGTPHCAAAAEAGAGSSSSRHPEARCQTADCRGEAARRRKRAPPLRELPLPSPVAGGYLL